MPSTGFTRFNTVESFSGITQSEAESLRATAAGGSQYSGAADMSTVTDQVALSGITHSVPSNATVVGIEMRIAVRAQSATNCSFQLTPTLFESSGTTSGTTSTVFPASSSSGGTFHNTTGSSTSMHNLSVTGAQVDDIGLVIRTASNSAGVQLRMMGHDTLGMAGLVIAPSINIHYTVPAFGTIDTWNTIPFNAAAAPSATPTVITSSNTLGTFTFAGQARQTSSTHSDTGGWSPSDPNVVGQLNMSGWANGADASANFNWKSSSNNNTPSIRSSQEAADWFMGPNTSTTSRGTASADTGPPSGIDINNLPSSLAASSAVDSATRFIFSETTGSDGRNHVKVCRTLGINFSTTMSDTSNQLDLCFYIHAHGATCGGLSVYIDDASTSSDAQATLLRNLECRTITSPSNPTTKVKEYASGGKTTGASVVAGTSEHTFTKVQTAGGTQDWAKITINLDTYRAVDETYYIYFAYSANNGTQTHNTDRLESGETAATASTFKGDFAIDQVFFQETAAAALFGKTLNQESTGATNMTKVNQNTVPS
jgi:hypothetical protein